MKITIFAINNYSHEKFYMFIHIVIVNFDRICTKTLKFLLKWHQKCQRYSEIVKKFASVFPCRVCNMTYMHVVVFIKLCIFTLPPFSPIRKDNKIVAYFFEYMYMYSITCLNRIALGPNFCSRHMTNSPAYLTADS